MIFIDEWSLQYFTKDATIADTVQISVRLFDLLLMEIVKVTLEYVKFSITGFLFCSGFFFFGNVASCFDFFLFCFVPFQRDGERLVRAELLLAVIMCDVM